MKPTCRIQKKSGFSLFEVLIAMVITGVILGSLTSLIVGAIRARNEAADMQTAIFLAEQTMNRIKTEKDTMSDQGEFEDFPGYSFDISVEEIEMDAFELLSGTGVEDQVDNAMLEYRRDNSMITESESGFINLHLLQYNVTILFGDNNKYELTMFRGTGVSVGNQ